MLIREQSLLVEKILQVAQSASASRAVIALAGAPASGKSTLAFALQQSIDLALGRPAAAILPMDGYHFDNAVIEPLGLLPRKGSPDTFDVASFEGTLARLKPLGSDATNITLEDVAVPVFDRELDLARAGARIIKPQQDILIVEGNYLLLEAEPWSRLKNYFDLTVMLDVAMDVLEKRLVERWLAHDHTEAQAIARASDNDLPNAALVIEQSVQADVRYEAPVVPAN